MLLADAQLKQALGVFQEIIERTGVVQTVYSVGQERCQANHFQRQLQEVLLPRRAGRLDKVDALPAHTLLKFELHLAVRKGLHLAAAQTDVEPCDDSLGRGAR